MNNLTCFAPAEKLPLSEVQRQYRIIAENKDLISILDGIPSMLSVLNMNRQIVFANRLIIDMVAATDINDVLGKRLGEIFGCQYAFKVNGCGTSENCSACGAVKTMLSCPANEVSVDECSLTNDVTTFDLRVRSTFTQVNGENFIVCALSDIGDEKRRGIMERIFFHDILNTINSINGISQILQLLPSDKQATYTSLLNQLVVSLSDEIDAHRILTLAEKQEYVLDKQQVQSIDFINEQAEKYEYAATAESKKIYVSKSSENHTFHTDKTLLSRVLGNMIKNALEAELPGSSIEIGVQKSDKMLHFYVRNKNIIPKMDTLKVFQRSFSTKGNNRGLGTYSIKFLTEKYLSGLVGFVSTPEQGTMFSVKIPIEETAKNQ